MADDQRHGRIFGVLFILTFVTSISALALFQPVLDDPAGYIAGGGKDNQIYLGAFLEFFLVITNVGTAVALYPIARRQNEALAIGYVGARESSRASSSRWGSSSCSASWACATTSRPRTTLPSRSPRSRTGRSCSAPGFVPFGNGLILGYLMYRSGLVPRRMAWLGMIGGPLLFLANVGVAVRLVGGDRPDRRSRRPGDHLGAVPRGLLRDLGIQEGLADRPPELARQCARLTLAQPHGSDCWPCRASSSPFSS